MKPSHAGAGALCLLLGGCGKMGLDPNEDTAPAAELRVDALDPDWGPTSGGNQVAISGAGFVGAVGVSFGNAELAVTVVDEQQLTVIAPDAGVEATVDVTVRSDLGEVLLEGGYSFSDDGPPPPDDTGETTTIDGIGGVVEFSHLMVACTTCFDPPYEAITVSAGAAFHEPAQQSWTEWLPDIGQCVTSFDNSPPASSFMDLGEMVYLNSGSLSIALVRTYDSGSVEYQPGSTLDNDDFSQNAAYDLLVPDGGELGAFELEDAVITGQHFSDIQPVGLIYTDPQSAFAPVLSASNATISYAPSGGTGSFLVLLGIYTPQGQYSGTVLCRDNDDGSITIPSSYFSGALPGSMLTVQMMRYQIEWTEAPTLGSFLESVVSIGILGTASLQ